MYNYHMVSIYTFILHKVYIYNNMDGENSQSFKVQCFIITAHWSKVVSLKYLFLKTTKKKKSIL